MSLTWMTIAMVIDGLDGPFARKYEISAVLPHIDGHIGDLIIDYVTTVIAPAFFIHEFDLLPKQYSLLGISLMLLTSLYLVSNTHIQSNDNYFNGFPAMWNLVINVLFVLQSPPTTNLIVVLVMSVFTIVPVKFIHPIRVRDFRKIDPRPGDLAGGDALPHLDHRRAHPGLRLGVPLVGGPLRPGARVPRGPVDRGCGYLADVPR